MIVILMMIVTGNSFFLQGGVWPRGPHPAVLDGLVWSVWSGSYGTYGAPRPCFQLAGCSSTSPYIGNAPSCAVCAVVCGGCGGALPLSCQPLAHHRVPR